MADQSWTGNWIATSLRKIDGVRHVEVVNQRIVRVDRRHLRAFVVGTVASEKVVPSDLSALFVQDHGVEFVVNIPKEAYWTGPAIDIVEKYAAAWGGYGDLLSALRDEDPRQHVNRDVRFLERGLRQHSKVSQLVRVDDRKYLIRTSGLPDLTLVVLDAYDVTADHVRTAHDRYGHADIVLHLNPNGSITTEAASAAASIGTKIYFWKDLLSMLGRRR